MRRWLVCLGALGLACRPAGTDGGLGTDGAAATDAGPATPVRTNVAFTTSDGAMLAGVLVTSADTEALSPGVLLVHQYGTDSNQWGDLPEALVAADYRVLAFDLRGHGASDPYTGTDYLTDPVAGPADLDAALAWFIDPAGGEACPDRVAIVGTSVGANLTVAAAIRGLARTYVSYSARLVRAESYAGAPAAGAGLTSVFYVAGELDPGGQAADAQTLFDLTADPRLLTVYAGTADHGIATLDNQADARPALLSWLASSL